MVLAQLQQAKALLIKQQKPIKIISHFDADGISSAAIIARTLQRLKKTFSLQIVKNLEDSFIQKLSDSYFLIFVDLASGSLPLLAGKNTDILIIDHHELPSAVPKNICMVNPNLDKEEAMSSAGLCYLFFKLFHGANKELATLAIIGMIGDVLDKDLKKAYDEIIKDADLSVRKSLLLYPATRSLDRALEYSFNPLIPGVSGSPKGVYELLKEAKVERQNGRYKSLIELTEQEMSNLLTAVTLRYRDKTPHDIVGNLYLIKFFGKLEDAREISALINACSRMDHPEIALSFCLGNKNAKESAERCYALYKQHLSAALRYAEGEEFQGQNYAVINGRDAIKDTIIGTVTSILSNSPRYPQGTILIGLAYNQEKIKVSARIAGRHGRNVRELLHQIVVPLGGEVGGHANAAGCLLAKNQEQQFLEQLQLIFSSKK